MDSPSGSRKLNRTLPDLLNLDEVQSRLALILPKEVTGQPILIGDITSRVVWTALYCGAIDHVKHIRPTMVCWMRDSIAEDRRASTRVKYWTAASRNQRAFEQAFPDVIGEPSWYRDNTREVIRDDILRNGLWSVGAVLRDESRPTNSSKPVWTLEAGFAELFSLDLSGKALSKLISSWQRNNLNEVMVGRLRKEQAAHTALHEVEVVLPSGSTRRLGAGTSSHIAKGVVEELATRVLIAPRVIAISEGREHLSDSDIKSLNLLGLELAGDRLLPDIVLHDDETSTLWCVEVVATDGPINEMRMRQLEAWACTAGFDKKRVRFVTAFESRTSPIFRNRVSTLARDSYVWFLDEPKLLMHLETL